MRRVTGVLVHPRATMAEVVRHPAFITTWAVVLLTYLMPPLEVYPRLAAFALSDNEALFVGDMPIDVHAARNSGIDVAVVPTGCAACPCAECPSAEDPPRRCCTFEDDGDQRVVAEAGLAQARRQRLLLEVDVELLHEVRLIFRQRQIPGEALVVAVPVVFNFRRVRLRG